MAEDVETLKRRGRRRLVGAIALVLVAVIVLPTMFDSQPRREPPPPVSIRIPGESETGFLSRPAPVPAPAASTKTPASATQPPARAGVKTATPKAAEYIVQVGVFANPENVLSTLSSAGIPHYREAMNERLTRVRAGPFSTKQAAEKALERLKRLGLEPGAVSQKSG